MTTPQTGASFSARLLNRCKSTSTVLVVANLVLLPFDSEAGFPLAGQGSDVGAATFTVNLDATWFQETAYYASAGFHAIASWRTGDTLAVGEDGTSWVLELGSPASTEIAVDLQLSHSLGWAEVSDANGNELWFAQPAAELHTLPGASGAVDCRLQMFKAGTELIYTDNPNGVEYTETPIADMAFEARGGSSKSVTSNRALATSNTDASESGLSYTGSGLNPRSWDRVRFVIAPPTGANSLPAGTRVRLAIDGGLLDRADLGTPRTEFYVSASGSDANDGSENAPFSSPARALASARASRLANTMLDKPITVWIGDGSYPMSSGIELTQADSGTTVSPLEFKALPGATPSFFGGRALNTESFAPVSDSAQRNRLSDSAGETALEIDLPAGFDPAEISRRGWLFKYEWGLRDMPEPVLVIGGRTMQLARWPNEGESDLVMESIVDPGPDRHDDTFWERGGSFTNNRIADRSRDWGASDDIWLSGTFGEAWAWSYNKVASITPDTDRVTLAHAEVDGLRNNEWTRSFFHAENIFEELDTPGEYFIDRDRSKLYVIPPEDFETADSYLTELDQPMIAARGVAHIRFEGITFEGGRTHGLVFQDCNDIAIHRCTIRAFSDDALTFTGENCSATACHIEEIGSTGVVLDGGDKTTLSPARNRVVNCTIRRNGRWDRSWRPAVSITGVGQEVRHCLLSDIPHMAIDIGGNDHRIEYNEITDAVQLLDDMCAVYFNTGDHLTERGTIVRRNHFHDIGVGADHSRGAVYFDNMTMGVEVCENTFERIGSAAHHWTVMNHGGADNLVERNTFIDCPLPLYIGFPLTSYFSGQAASYLSAWQNSYTATAGFTDTVFGASYPELKTFFEADPKLPNTNTFRDNTMLCPNVHLAHEGGIEIGDGAPGSLIDTTGNRIDPAAYLAPAHSAFTGLLASSDAVTPRDWSLAHFGFGNNVDWSADPDHDGLPNALEFVLGSAPNIANAQGSAWVTQEIIDGHAELRAEVSPNAALCRCLPETSPNLATWSRDNHTITEVDTGISGEICFRDTRPAGATNAQFARVALELFE